MPYLSPYACTFFFSSNTAVCPGASHFPECVAPSYWQVEAARCQALRKVPGTGSRCVEDQYRSGTNVCSSIGGRM